MSKKQPWERLPSEPNLWWCRFEAFRAAGPKRSMLAIYNGERVAKGLTESPGKGLPGSWRAAAKTYRWVKRAQAWDSFVVAEKSRRMEEERQAVFEEGLALDYVRVQHLQKLAAWLEDERTKGFDPDVIKQLRGTLDDLAAETGGRIKTTKNLNFDMTDWPDAAIDRVAAGEDPIKVLASLAKGAK